MLIMRWISIIFLFIFLIQLKSEACIYINTGKKVIAEKIKSQTTDPVHIMGGGILELLQASEYFSDTIIDAHILLSTNQSSIGALEKIVSVLESGHVSGFGSILGNVKNKGQLEPAFSQSEFSSSLKILGNYEQLQNGRLSLDASPGEQETLQIVGAARFFGGEIEISPVKAAYPKIPVYKILVSWREKIGEDPDITVTNANAQIVYKIDEQGLWGALIALPKDEIKADQSVNIVALQNVGEAKSVVNVPENVTLHASKGQNQTIDLPVTFTGAATIKPVSNSVIEFAKPITASVNSQLFLQGSGTTKIAANTDNTQTLKAPILAKQTNIQVEDQANLGSAKLTLEQSTLTLGNTTLKNPISVTQASTISTTTKSKAVLDSAISGSEKITVSGSGRLELKAASKDFTGILDAEEGELKINADFSNSKIIIQENALMSGSSTVGSVDHYGVLKPGNSIGIINMMGDYKAINNPRYGVEINSERMSDLITVSGNTILAQTTGGASSYTVDVLLDKGEYTRGVTNYKILKSEKPIQGIATKLTWHDQGVTLDGVTPKIKLELGVYQEKYLLLKSTISQKFSVEEDQTEPGISSILYTNDLSANPEATLFGETVVNPGEAEGTYYVAPPVGEQPEITSIVFAKPDTDQEIKGALEDKFRFQSSSSYRQKPMSIDQSLSVLSQMGPVSLQKKQMRLWISPFLTRRRFEGTSISTGFQGWGGGSLGGIERRNEANTYTLGLMTGLMYSKSSKIFQPHTYSKMTGLILGAYNTYKYMDDPYKGTFTHELLASHTISQIKGQRYGIDGITSLPYLAQSNYRSHTSLLNGQLNYIFTIIPKEITCRLDSGYTYSRNYTGRYSERNASTNGINYARSSSSNQEFYNGLGLRKIWDNGTVIVRTTAVYEYGYVVKTKSSASTLSLQNSSPIAYSIPTDQQHHKHYVQVNGSVLDRSKGFKFSLAYSGTFSHQFANHTTMFKIERRF